MNMRGLMMLALAVLFGAAAAFVARGVLLNRSAPPPVAEGPAMTTVVVANKTLHFGDALSRDYVREVAWPATTVPQGAFAKTEELFTGDGRRVVLRDIAQDEPVLQTRVSGFGGRAILSAVITEDMRAVTIRVNDVNGVAGFVLPGDLVDVLLTRQEAGGGAENQITDVLLQHVKVLGIDQDPSDKTDKPTVVRAVTLEVSTEQAEKLALATQVGSLSLALRNAGNAKEAYVPRIRVKDLGPAEPKAPVAVAEKKKAPVVYRPRNPEMAITRGTETTMHEVPAEAAPGGWSSSKDGAGPGPKALAKPKAKEPAATEAKPLSSAAGKTAAQPAATQAGS